MRRVIPEGDIKGQSIDCVLMSFQFVKQISSFGVPHLASSIVAASDESKSGGEYLSPFLLKQQLVRGRTWAFRVLKSWKF